MSIRETGGKDRGWFGCLLMVLAILGIMCAAKAGMFR